MVSPSLAIVMLSEGKMFYKNLGSNFEVRPVVPGDRMILVFQKKQDLLVCKIIDERS